MLSGDAEIGPIPVPAKVAKACKVGWDVGGVVGLSKQGLAIGRGLEHLAVKVE